MTSMRVLDSAAVGVTVIQGRDEEEKIPLCPEGGGEKGFSNLTLTFVEIDL